MSEQLVAAVRIYEGAVKRARIDHKKMVRQFMRGQIPIATPCGIDRERDYIIMDFAAALSRSSAVARATGES